MPVVRGAGDVAAQRRVTLAKVHSGAPDRAARRAEGTIECRRRLGRGCTGGLDGSAGSEEDARQWPWLDAGVPPAGSRRRPDTPGASADGSQFAFVAGTADASVGLFSFSTPLLPVLAQYTQATLTADHVEL
jgi:hypothetical protein